MDIYYKYLCGFNRGNEKLKDITTKAKHLHKSFEEIIYHFQSVNATTSDSVENLSLQETKAIGFLGQHGECIMREIADYLRVAVSTVTGLVDKLEDKKFVKRERSDEDRRIIKIALTPKGQEIYKFHVEEFSKLCRGMLMGMTDEEQDLYVELSRKIALFAKDNFSKNSDGDLN